MVSVEITGDGIVVVVCSDVLVWLYGAGPQPDSTAMPAISAARVAIRRHDVLLIMRWIPEVQEMRCGAEPLSACSFRCVSLSSM
jgi:hypothetical protein